MPDTVSTRQSDAPHCALSRARRSHALDLRRSRPERGILSARRAVPGLRRQAALRRRDKQQNPHEMCTF